MTCRTVFRFLCDNFDVDLNSPKCRKIKLHIDGCKNCSVYLDSLKKTILLYREYATPDVPPTARKKLFAALALDSIKTAKQRRS